MRANYGGPIRKWLKAQAIEEIVDFGALPVFKGVTTYPCIIRIRKSNAGVPSREKKGKELGASASPREISVAEIDTLDFTDLRKYVLRKRYPVQRETLDDKGWSLSNNRTQALLAKIRAAGVPLGEYVDGKIYYGIKTGLNEAFVIDRAMRDRLIAEDPKSVEIIKPFLAGRDIKRYQPLHSDKYLIFTRHGINIKKYPAIEKHLSLYKPRLMPKPADWRGRDWPGRKPGSYKWYEKQDTIDYHDEFEKPKIIIPAIVQSASYGFDKNKFYSNDKTSIISSGDPYLLGVLNSRISDLVLHSISSTKQGGYFEYKPMYVSKIPIRPIDFSNRADKSRHDRMVNLVEQMLLAKQHLSAAKSDADKDFYQNKCAGLDRQIDALVYELYGLTPEEIRIVEGASA
jgi:hypothetical protein